MTRVETIDALASDPRGKFFVGQNWLSFFAPHGRFSGTIVWGRPSSSDVEQWEACADLRLSPICEPHATLFDAHKVENLSPSAFGTLARYASKRMGRLSGGITRLAIVHAGTFAGAVAAGFTKLVPVPFPVEVFSDTTSALAWLGSESDAALLEEIWAAQDEARAVAPIVRQLAAYLAHHPRATPADAARALALSTRSLQRRLTEQKTTFRRELDAARVRLAQRLLRDSDATVTEVAMQVGLTSPQHLSTLFRRLGNAPPAEWRKKP
jgi:AraC-like DNA-binding protein